jgi:hypothetical protein
MGRAGASCWAICGGEIYAILFQTECKIEERGLFQEEGARPPSEGHKSLGRAGGAPQTTFGASSEPLQGAFFEIFILGQGGLAALTMGHRTREADRGHSLWIYSLAIALLS